eukprot:TRINITY_DN6775_c0_g1_i1.p1 TRINITY_DN6775_c0_g1~~TRINITY_DN6775_c0_g1_i1.p1  ORF type:complete len:278 (+),score=42.03 TRINITY_DN6775_c0_g1_i1:128-961(+)
MGNSAVCCSAGNDRCCSGTKDAAQTDHPGVGAPVGAGPIPSSEVMGVDRTPAPGMKTTADIANVGGLADGNDLGADTVPGKGESATNYLEVVPTKEAAEVCPGGDSAAGGAGISGGDKQEYQYVTYEDGSTYIGQIADGKRQGHGIWQSRTGQYEGQWKADSQHGKGRQTWSDGRVYDGQFLNGRFAGRGRMVWHTQKGMLIYEGQYRDDLKHGEGKFVWADGRTYDGEWQKGKRHGRGMYMNARSERKIGYWREDKFDRWESPNNEDGTPAASPSP